jgi:ketosteroid isomerase-like protein
LVEVKSEEETVPADIRSTLDAYFGGINEERYDDVAALFAAAGELRAPGIDPVNGGEAIASYFRAALAPYPRHRDEPTRTILAEDGKTATVEISFKGLTAEGDELRFEAVDVFDFDAEGRIVLLTSWYDSHAVRSWLRTVRAAKP